MSFTVTFAFNAFADPAECRKNGCSITECAAANQNGYSCKAWKCFGRCMSSKGFHGSCYKNPSKLQECTQAGYSCETQCKYK